MMDGNIAYQGYACQCANYFAKIGSPCPTYQNPTDFYMKKLSVNYPLEKEDIEKSAFFDLNYKNDLAITVSDAIE